MLRLKNCVESHYALIQTLAQPGGHSKGLIDLWNQGCPGHTYAP